MIVHHIDWPKNIHKYVIIVKEESVDHGCFVREIVCFYLEPDYIIYIQILNLILMIKDDHTKLRVIVVGHIKNVSFFVLDYLLRINVLTGELDRVEVLVNLQVINDNCVVSHR